MSSPRCLICTAPTKYAHYGVNACRSCADFFKRTTEANRSYACRQGDGMCSLNPKDRVNNCRGCRLEKCKRLGMKYDEESTPLSIDTTSFIQPTEPLLSKISREYSASVGRRKSAEIALRSTSLRRHVRANFVGEDLLLCSWTFLIDCLKMFAADHLQFGTYCFPEFAAFSLKDKRLMLKNFGSRLYAVEVQCDTFRKFASHDGPYYMATLTTCFDSQNYQFFTEEEMPTLSDDISRLMAHFSERGRSLYGPILAKSRFTDIEYAVIFALSMWQIDPNQCLSDHIVIACEFVRGRIIEALKEYYQEELRLEEYSVRLGNLITFEHTMQECTNLLEEEVQTYNLAGLISSDASFLQSIMQIPF